MDIASVYLNLSSFLDTEIEVEGYYDYWNHSIYSLEKDLQSLRIVLPAYVSREGITDLNHILYEGAWLKKMTLRGRLKQDARGEPTLDPICLIKYVGDGLIYEAVLTSNDNITTCKMCAKITCHIPNLSASYFMFQQSFFISKGLEKLILLKGSLVAPGFSHDLGAPVSKDFSLRVENSTSDPQDFLRQFAFMLLYYTVITPLVIVTNLGQGNLKQLIRMLLGNPQRFYGFVWIDPQDSLYLRQYLVARLSDGYSRLQDNTIQFLFAGRLMRIDKKQRRAYRLANIDVSRSYRLRFSPLDYVQLSKTITFQRPQDE